VERWQATNSFTDVKATDDKTVVYTLKQPGFCPAVLNSGLPGPIPKHVFETLDINQNDQNLKPSVISGLFFVKEWVKDDHATFSPAYKDYVRGQANLDTYNYRIVKDNTVQTQMFKTQEVDFAAPDPVDWEEISKLPHAQTFRYYSPAASWTYIGYNLKHPVLGDKKVRQAIAHAVNVKEMVDKIRLGFAKQQFSNITPSSWAYSDDVPKFEYNMDKAKAMLKEAGLTLVNGKLQKDGKDIAFRLHYNAGNKQREQIAIITQQALKDLGMEAEVIAEEWNAYLTRVQKSKDFDMFVLGWSGGTDPYSTGPIWQSTGSQNYGGYANADVDKWYDEAAVVKGCAQADRKAIYAKIQKQIAEDQPYLFLYTNETLLAVNKRVQVNQISKTGFGGVSYDIQKWTATQQATK
jgi:peptide/nickel transport system substrate-binding protein